MWMVKMRNLSKVIPTVGLLISVFTISAHADVSNIQMLPPTAASGGATVCGTGTNNLLTMAGNGSSGASAINCVANTSLDASGNLTTSGNMQGGAYVSSNDTSLLGQRNWNSLLLKNWSGAWPFNSIGTGPTAAISLGSFTPTVGNVIGNTGAVDATGINYDVNSDIIFYTGSVATAAGQAGTPADRLHIMQNGNVGIGTQNPGGNLDVENGSNTATLCLNGSCVNTLNTSIQMQKPNQILYDSVAFDWKTFPLSGIPNGAKFVMIQYAYELIGPDNVGNSYIYARANDSSPQYIVTAGRCAGSADQCGSAGQSIIPIDIKTGSIQISVSQAFTGFYQISVIGFE